MQNSNHGYQEKRTTLQKLFESKRTKEPSVNALRERAQEGVLVYLENNGPTQYYDEELSVIRVNAARICKKPRVFWKDIRRIFKELDRDINSLIIKNLNSGVPEQTVMDMISKLIKNKLNI